MYNLVIGNFHSTKKWPSKVRIMKKIKKWQSNYIFNHWTNNHRVLIKSMQSTYLRPFLWFCWVEAVVVSTFVTLGQFFGVSTVATQPSRSCHPISK